MSTIPKIFLLGPPGSGKTTLGQAACTRLGLRFLDSPEGSSPQSALQADADVVALPWSAVDDRPLMKEARRAGVLVGLWAHPEEMQERSGRAEALFTPSPRLKSGFGRNGTACPEFRRLDRGCEEVVLLNGMELAEAIDVVAEAIGDHREGDEDATPAEKAGITGWVNGWRSDVDAKPAAAQVLVDAMGQYLVQLAAAGTSPRTLRGIESDLYAAGLLVFMYDAPTAKQVRSCFSYVPYDFEFKRKFSDSPNAIARYKRSVGGFVEFLGHGDDEE